MGLKNAIHLNLIGYGGAWHAAKRISDSINLEGCESEVINVLNLRNKYTKTFRSAFKIDHSFAKMTGTPTSISITRGFASNQWISNLNDLGIEADVWNLHWMPGHINSDFIEFFRHKSVVWTIHDMNPFTGACHYSGSCMEFRAECKHCPQVPALLNTIVMGLLQNKINAIRQIKNLTFVSPSEWLLSSFKQSALGRDLQIKHIPNPVPTRNMSRDIKITVPTVTILGSNYLYSKNSEIGARAICKLVEQFPDSQFNLQVIGSPFLEIPIHQKCLPIGSSQEDTNNFLDQSDVFLYTSTLDNLPNLVIEAQSAGNVVIAFDRGGISECFRPDISGIIVEECVEEICSELLKLFSNEEKMSEMAKRGRQFVEEKFSPKKVGSSYIALYKEIC